MQIHSAPSALAWRCARAARSSAAVRAYVPCAKACRMLLDSGRGRNGVADVCRALSASRRPSRSVSSRVKELMRALVVGPGTAASRRSRGTLTARDETREVGEAGRELSTDWCCRSGSWCHHRVGCSSRGLLGVPSYRRALLRRCATLAHRGISVDWSEGE